MAASVDESINLSCSTEYKDYVYNTKQDIWTLVSLKAPLQEEDESDEKRPPVDVVAVIDISGSMSGGKLALIKKTLEYFLTQLNSKDRLSLVTYDTNVYLNFQLKAMNKENKEAALQSIKALKTGSSTNLCGGLMKGLVQIVNRGAGEKNEVASVLLFTDGLANHGITNTAGIVAAMKDPKRYDGPSASTGFGGGNVRKRGGGSPPHQSWLQKVLGTGKKESEPPKEVEEKEIVGGGPADASVYTFGFGEDHDPDMLKQISDAGNGMYYYIENEDQVAESFGHCLGGIMSTVAQGIQLEVVTKDGVTIKEVHTGRPVEKTQTSCKVNMGDLQSEESRDVVVELTIDALAAPQIDPAQHLFDARCDCFNVISKQLESKCFRLTVLRPEQTEEHDEKSADSALNLQKERVEMTRAMQEISEVASRGDLDLARAKVSKARGKISSRMKFESNEISISAYNAMTEDLNMYATNLSSTSVWNSRGRKVASNMIQLQQAQRSNNVRSKQFSAKEKESKAMQARNYASGP